MQRLPEAELPDDVLIDNRIVRAVYNNPEMFKGFASLSGRVHSTSRLPDRLRELIVMRTLYRIDSTYEISLHEPQALKMGITEVELAGLKSGDFTVVSAAEAAALKFCDASNDVTTTDELWEVTAQHFSPQEISDMALLTGFYAMAGKYLLAMGIVAE